MKINYSQKNHYKRPLKWVLLLLYFSIFYLIFPVSIAVFIAYLAYPLLQFFNRYMKLPFWLAAMITEILIIALFSSIALLTLQNIISLLPSLKNSLTNFTLLEQYNSYLLTYIQEKSMTIFEFFFSKLTYFIQHLLTYIVEFFIFAIALFLSLFESRKSRTWFFIYVPSIYRAEWKNYFTQGMKLFTYFLFVEFQLVVLTFLLLSAGLSMLHFQHAIHLAFIISLADSLPFFGIGIFLVPLSIYYFLLGDSTLSGALILLYIFIQLIRQLAESMLWASTLHLRTVHTFFISAASILLFGFYGILLSPFLLFLAVRFKDKAQTPTNAVQ